MNHLRVTISLCVLISIGFFGSAFAVEVGACCLNTEQCGVTTLNECISNNGTYMGNETVCNSDYTCPYAGACCFEDNTCFELFEEECVYNDGNYAGDQQPCGPSFTCPDEYNSGACCIGGGCLNMPLMTCTQFNGIYQGNTGFCEDEAVSCIASCAEDFDGDGDVDVSGLLQLIAAWGMCP